MATIYLARHGQDYDNAAGILNGHRNTPLTAIGADQARQLSQKIKEAGIQSALFTALHYSVHLKRQKQSRRR